MTGDLVHGLLRAPDHRIPRLGGGIQLRLAGPLRLVENHRKYRGVGIDVPMFHITQLNWGYISIISPLLRYTIVNDYINSDDKDHIIISNSWGFFITQLSPVMEK